MTTIVANLEGMAADQRITGAGPYAHTRKIHRIGDSLFGLAGCIDPGLVFIDWLRTKRLRPQLYKLLGGEEVRDSFIVMELSASGLSLWSGWGAPVPLLDSSYAIGTGAMAALAALRDGKPLHEAVMRGPSLDECSGCVEPQVEYLLPPELRRKRRV